MAPMLNAAMTGSSSYEVPGTLAPPGRVAPGTTGPRREAAGQCVEQAVVRGLVGKIRVDLVVADVVSDVGKNGVPVGTDSRANISS